MHVLRVDQVAELFQGHEDLLGEFGNFLPDPAGAKGGAMTKVAKKKPAGSRMGLGASMPGGASHHGQHIDKHKLAAKGMGAGDVKGQKHKEKKVEEMSKEGLLLEKLKDKLMAQSPAVYNDFLKCLALYVQEVLTATELALVLDDMLSSSSEMKGLLEELKGYIGLREAQVINTRTQNRTGAHTIAIAYTRVRTHPSAHSRNHTYTHIVR